MLFLKPAFTRSLQVLEQYFMAYLIFVRLFFCILEKTYNSYEISEL